MFEGVSRPAVICPTGSGTAAKPMPSQGEERNKMAGNSYLVCSHQQKKVFQIKQQKCCIKGAGVSAACKFILVVYCSVLIEVLLKKPSIIPLTTSHFVRMWDASFIWRFLRTQHHVPCYPTAYRRQMFEPRRSSCGLYLKICRHLLSWRVVHMHTMT